MTKHCLIQSTLALVLGAASQLHGKDDNEDGIGNTDFVHWRYKPGTSADKIVRWRSRVVDGSIVSWCLEVEQGANGVLAHLSASAVSGPVTRLPRGLCGLALQTWSRVELATLAKATEPVSAARPRATDLS